MGQCADLSTTGEMCSYCGVEFMEPHGYPVVCKRCYSELSREEKDEVIEAKIEEC